MVVAAQLIATLAIPSARADCVPGVLRWPAGPRLVTLRTDAELIAYDLDRLRSDPQAAPVRWLTFAEDSSAAHLWRVR